MKTCFKKITTVLVICCMLCVMCPVMLVYGADATTSFNEVSYIKGSQADTATVEIALNGNEISKVIVDEDVLTETTDDIEADYVTYINADDECFLTIEFSYLDKLEAGTHVIKIAYANSSQYTEIELKILDWGNVIIENDIINFVDEKGVVSAQIRDDGLTWIKEDLNDTLVAIGNTSNSFEYGSRFHVQLLDKEDTANQWDKYFLNLDDKYKDKIDDKKAYVLELGVEMLDGTSYKDFGGTAPLYVQLPSDWDSNDLKALCVDAGQDEEFDVSVEEVEINGEKSNFAVIILEHFSTYIIYDETVQGQNDIPITPNDGNIAPSVPETGDTNMLGLWIAIALISGVALFTTKLEKRH